MDSATHDRICKTYWDIRERGQGDPEYARLRETMAELEARYETAVRDLPEEQRLAIELYIACRESMGRRMLELACGEL